MQKEDIRYSLANKLIQLAKLSSTVDNFDGINKLADDLLLPIQIMVIGEWSAGKSTLINAILGKKVAITSAVPTTAVITKFVYGDKDRIFVHFQNGMKEEYSDKQFKQLTAEVDEQGNNIRSKIQYVERQLPNELLKEYNFIDSPGLNDIESKHVNITNDFLHNIDATLWVISADHVGTATDKKLLALLSNHLKPIAIVNKIDAIDEEEGDSVDDIIERVKINFDEDISLAIPVSAEMALQGKLKNNHELLKFSNLDMVVNAINMNIVTNTAKIKAKKMMIDFVPIMKILVSKLEKLLVKAKSSKEKNYEQYVAKLAEMANLNENIRQKIDLILQDLGYIFQNSSQLDNDEHYKKLTNYVQHQIDYARNTVGNTLYYALLGDSKAQYDYATTEKNENYIIKYYWYIESFKQGYEPAKKIIQELYQTACKVYQYLKSTAFSKKNADFQKAKFLFLLDLKYNNNSKSANKLGIMYEKLGDWNQAQSWYAKAIAMGNTMALVHNADILYFKLKNKLAAMKYYLLGLFHGNKYCGKMILKYTSLRLVGIFAIYILSSVAIHAINIYAYCERNVQIIKDNDKYESDLYYLDKIESIIKNKGYQYFYINNDEVERIRGKIDDIRKLSEHVPVAEKEFHDKYDKIIALDKYFLLHDFIAARYYKVEDNEILIKYADYYDDMLADIQNNIDKINIINQKMINNYSNDNNRQKQTGISKNDINAAADSFKDYHAAISNHNFNKAYSMMTPNRKKGMGSLDQFAAGYANTLDSDVTDVRYVSSEDNEIVLKYRLKSRDRANNGRTLVQIFDGQAHMFNLNGKWCVGYTEARKVNESYE